ncbi:MAG: MerR family transcriptional regulator [Alcanivoracaceae bacterium]|nr:MerR family transcriptional regulator [Alcanivoracaceae bacterium]
MKIGQLSKSIDISTFTIRYYEKIGLLNQPLKDESGHRVYDKKDLELINWVTCLKKSGMSLERIKEYTKAYRNDEDNKVAKLLELHLQKLKTQQIDLQHYIDVTVKKLKNLKNRLT